MGIILRQVNRALLNMGQTQWMLMHAEPSHISRTKQTGIRKICAHVSQCMDMQATCCARHAPCLQCKLNTASGGMTTLTVCGPAFNAVTNVCSW